MTCLFFLIREAFSFFRKSGSILDIVFFFLKIRNFKANILRSREQCKQTCLICIAEAPQDMWRSQISKKPRACPEAPQDMWRSQISKKPRACAEAPQDMWRSQISKKPNIEEAESLPKEALQDMWRSQIYSEAESNANELVQFAFIYSFPNQRDCQKT